MLSVQPGILRQQLKRVENCAYRDDSFLTMVFLMGTIVLVLIGVGLITRWLVVSARADQRVMSPIMKTLTVVFGGMTRKQPDIVLILADDAGYSDLGCYGGEIETPALDRLAANGLRFSQFYNTGRCCPSRAALLSGVYQHQAGMGHMTKDRGIPSYSGTILPHVPTLAERLRKGGYRTMMTGKWHLGTEPKQSPIARGFDRFYGTRNFIDSYFTVLKHCPVFLDDKEVLPGTETPVNHLHPDQRMVYHGCLYRLRPAFHG